MLIELWNDLRYRVRALFRRADLDRELDLEIGAHLEREASLYERQGMTPAEARRQARLAFGALQDVKERSRDARGTAFFESLVQDGRYALRSLRLRPAFTVAVVGTLALGIGANAAMFGIVDRLMFRTPAALRDADRVHRVHLRWTQDGRERSERHTSVPRLQDFVRDTTTLDLVAAFQVRTAALGQGEDTREGRVAIVSAGVLDFFDAAPPLGRWFTRDEDQPPLGAAVVVLSNAYWKAHYGGRADVLGEQLHVDRLQATIIGVAPPGFTGISDAGAPLVFVPMSAFAHALRGGPAYASSYNWNWLEVLVRRRPGVTMADATRDLTEAFRRSWDAEDEARGRTSDRARSQATADLGPVHLGRGPDAQLDARVSLWVLGVALVVLLVGCANVANLFLSRAVSRQREVAMRQALGVSRARLTRQFLLESLALGILGGLGGLVLAWLAGGAFRTLLLPEAETAAVMTDTRTVLYTFALAVLAGGLTTLVPAVMAARLDVAASLKAGGRSNTRPRSRVQSALVVVQVALSVLLLAGAALFVSSLQRAQTHRLGFDVERLLLAGVNFRGVQLPDAEMQHLVARMLETAREIPGVRHASMAVSVPFWTSEGRALFVPGVDDVRQLGTFTLQVGSSDYFATTGTRILRGRAFNDTDGDGAMPVVVVSDGMARALWPGLEALGQCLRVGDEHGPCRTVIGVAEENAMRSLEPSSEFMYYLPVAQIPESTTAQVFIRVAEGQPPPLAVARARLQALLHGAAYVNVVPLDDIVAPQYRAWRVGATVFVAFGALAAILAALGLYSLVAYDATQRTQEFAVRLALGALRHDIMQLVVGRGARLAAMGVAAGTVLFLTVSHHLEALMFHQSVRDPLILVSVAAALVTVAGVASAIPGLRATHVNPSVALRSD